MMKFKMGFCCIRSRVPQIPNLPIPPNSYNNIDEHKMRPPPMRQVPLLYYNNNNNNNKNMPEKKKKKKKWANNYKGGGGSSLALAALALTSWSTGGGGCSSSSSSSNVRVNSNKNNKNNKNNNLGKKWKEYQGVENWEGLLDPLDDNLRKEILRYGQFVDAAYKSFDFDPCSPSYGTCLHSKSSLFHRSGLPSTGYRVCKHLKATSGIRLPPWLMMINNNPPPPNSTWIGYVAVCQDKHEISRLGRRDVVIAFRGTATLLEWLENVRATLTKLPGHEDQDDDDESSCMVESGFLSLYTSETESCQSLREMVREEISRVVESYDADDPVSLTITGHSLGAALATLAAYDIKQLFPKMMVTVMSFGGPRVGNSNFRKRLEKQGTKVLRIVNSDDVITKLPGFLLLDQEDHHHGHLLHHHHHNKFDNRSAAGSCSTWIHKCLQDTKWAWAYSEVGRELRLSSRSDSPHLLTGIINNVATSHHLNTYLHLVDGSFVSSTSSSFTPPQPPS